MAKSFGEALATGEPVVMTRRCDDPKDVILQAGQEKRALELLEELGIIRLMYTTKGKLKK